MSVIRTVLGDINAGTLGWCECQEHLFAANDIVRGDDDVLQSDDYDTMVSALMRFKNAGGSSILDGQTLGRGRMGSALVKASQQTGVSIIASTGFHMQALYAKSFIFSLEKVAMEKLFINELTYGMLGKDNEYLGSFCAGIIKTAVDTGGILKNKISEKLFTAAARAAAKTGAPVMVHVDYGADAHSVMTFFADHGVSPNRLIFCQPSTACPDMSIHETLAQAGAYIAYDAKSLDSGMMLHMLSAGHHERVLIRNGTQGGMAMLDALVESRQSVMRRLDIDSSTMDIIMRQNPAKALSFKK